MTVHFRTVAGTRLRTPFEETYVVSKFLEYDRDKGWVKFIAKEGGTRTVRPEHIAKVR